MKRLLLLLLLPLMGMAQDDPAYPERKKKQPKPSYTMEDIIRLYPIDSLTGKLKYEGVVEVPGVSATQLYGRAKKFFFESFKSAKGVIDIEDRETGTIAGKGLFNYPPELLATIPAFYRSFIRNAYYKIPIEIRVKDGRFKYKFTTTSVITNGIEVPLDTDYRSVWSNPKARMERITEEQYLGAAAFSARMNALVQAIEKQMKDPVDKDDW